MSKSFLDDVLGECHGLICRTLIATEPGATRGGVSLSDVGDRAAKILEDMIREAPSAGDPGTFNAFGLLRVTVGWCDQCFKEKGVGGSGPEIKSALV